MQARGVPMQAVGLRKGYSVDFGQSRFESWSVKNDPVAIHVGLPDWVDPRGGHHR